LRTFDNSADRNPGRLNVYDLDGVNVIVDFAHNEAGLVVLLDFAHALLGSGGQLIAVIGTAGDRTDESLRELGRIAASWADQVIAKGTKKYLRGREQEELLALYAEGARQKPETPYREAPTELAALEQAIALAKPGDAIAVMAQEDHTPILDVLRERGARAV
jgi:cyanophycin synthetase